MLKLDFERHDSYQKMECFALGNTKNTSLQSVNRHGQPSESLAEFNVLHNPEQLSKEFEIRVFLLLGGLPPIAVEPHLPRAVWFSPKQKITTWSARSAEGASFLEKSWGMLPLKILDF